MNKFSCVSDEWKESVFGEDQLTIRVLVVADGDVNFNTGEFGLTRFLAALGKSASPGEIVKVTTAHRSSRPTTLADLPNFTFDQVPGGLHIDNYEQVWLFGFQGECDPAITDAELRVITDFMSKGGGVFATGDHADLGAAMCGNIPRVRKMRRWHVKKLSPNERPAPSRNNSTRIDTLREGIDPGFKSDDQKDAVPQEIRPKFFFNQCRATVQPHDLLATQTFAISILPDHMHEGECVSAKELRDRMDEDQEIKSDFPERDGTNERVWPEIVAIATSAAGTFDPKEKIFPVDPRAFIVISAYDGHEAEVKDDTGTHPLGRVVVDASFHHFVNVNLNGFFDCDVPKEEFEMFARYYGNTLHWLLPPDKQRVYFLHLLRALRFSAPLVEDVRNLSANDWGDVIYAGTITNKAISENFSPAHARRCALAMIRDLKPDELRKDLKEVIDLWQPRHETDDSLFFLNSDSVVIAVLGHAILGLTSSLPGNQYEVGQAVTKLRDEGDTLQTVVTKKFQHGVTQLQKRLGGLAIHLDRISKISAT